MTEAPMVQLYLQDRLLAEVPFEADALRIGRMKENDLVVNNLAVSRFHAVLRRRGAGFEIEDLGSENGTYVAGQRVRGVTSFAVDQAVGVGQHVIVVRSPGEAAVACEEAEVIEDVTVVDEGFSDFPTATATAATETAAGLAPPIPEPPDAGPQPDAEASDARDGLDAPFAADEMENAVSEAELLSEEPPVATDSPDPTGAFAFGEEDIPPDDEVDLLGIDEDGPSAADPLVDPLVDPAGAPTAGPPSGEHTALFDFGLTGDLASTDPGTPAKDAAQTPPDPPPGPVSADADTASSGAAPAMPPVALHEPFTEELPSPAAEYAGLIVQRGGQLERVVAWSEAAMMAGRGKDCEVPLPDADVSRRHAAFERTGAGYRVIDQGSVNGIRVNGERVATHELEVGDVVGIGDFELTFVLDRQPVGEGIRLPEPKPRNDVDVREQTMMAGFDEPTDPAAGHAPGPTHLDLIDEVDDEDDKELECSVSAALSAPAAPASASTGGEAAPLRVELELPADRLPQAIRDALASLEEDDLVLTAEVRFRVRPA